MVDAKNIIVKCPLYTDRLILVSLLSFGKQNLIEIATILPHYCYYLLKNSYI